jgi:ABC-type Mn2+/Zn2+ transport system permease subunit
MNHFWETVSANWYMLLVGPGIGAMCAILSVYVVLRKMALISEGVSHAAFGGISFALLIGYFIPMMDNLLWWEIIAGIFCISTAMLIGYVTRRKRVTEDSAIGIFLVTSVALGQVFIRVRSLMPSKGRPMPVNLESLLFGDFVSVNRVDVAVVCITLVVILGIIGTMYYQFLYTTLDEEMARVNGVNTRLVNALLLVMISVVIVVCVRMVGSLIITALMIIPGATAAMMSRKFGGVLILSLVIGTLGTSAATAVALVPPLDRFSTGPLVVLTLFVVFAVVWALRHFFKPRAEADVEVALPHDHANPSAFGHGHVH